MKHVTIIGGGITGLAAAFYLQERAREANQDVTYTLLERAPRLGGKVQTIRQDGFTLECGPDSFITQKPWATQLCRDLGLEDRLLPCNEKNQKVFILTGGRLVPLPVGFRLTIPTKAWALMSSPLLSFHGKCRMLMERFIPPRMDEADESLASFLQRRFGKEALYKVAGPLMAGIYMADPNRLSVLSTFPQFVALEKKYGSLIKGLAYMNANRPEGHKPMAMFVSLKSGMGELVDTLEQKLEGEIRMNCTVTGLQRLGKKYIVQTGPNGEESLETDRVIFTTPSSVTSRLIKTLHPALGVDLEGIRYVTTATISLGYKRSDLVERYGSKGFGFIVPDKSDAHLVACTWSSGKFDHRAPSDGFLVRGFFGGARDEVTAELDDQKLVDLMRQDLAAIMGIEGEPDLQLITRWPNGNPQYDVGHLAYVDRLERRLSSMPGLYLSGSAYRGIGLPDCIESASATVDKILGKK